jgi:hypothetical protein
MLFAQKVLAPGPGTRAKPPSSGPQDESALSGSLIFKPPALAEVMIEINGKEGGKWNLKP